MFTSTSTSTLRFLHPIIRYALQYIMYDIWCHICSTCNTYSCFGRVQFTCCWMSITPVLCDLFFLPVVFGTQFAPKYIMITSIVCAFPRISSPSVTKTIFTFFANSIASAQCFTTLNYALHLWNIFSFSFYWLHFGLSGSIGSGAWLFGIFAFCNVY